MPGQSTDAHSALLEAAAKAVAAGDWELADRIRALLGTAPATVDPSPLASVHQLTSARKRK